MRVLLIQPPFVQFNSPYPAVHYLEAFLRAAGHDAEASDHTAPLHRAIFGRHGLERVFEDAEKAMAGRSAPDAATARALERYFSQKDRYLAVADTVIDFLRGADPAAAHFLSNERMLPRGNRLDALLSDEEGPTGSDFARAAATRILDDLGDLVSYALDPEYGTVRYAERIAASRADYGFVRAAADGYLMRTFYRPWLKDFFGQRAKDKPALVGLSIPFPGCAAGAIAAAREAKAAFGDGTLVVAGGGYVTTELRLLSDPAVFKDFDRLVFDAGYGGLASIVEELEGGSGGLYRVMMAGPDGAVERHGFPERDDANSVGSVIGCPEAERFAANETWALRDVFPDYRSADFGALPKVLDSTNPMHRLWNDAPWLKYHLAHGCYWRKCAFCDTELDYVGRFVPANATRLLEAAQAAAERTGLSGIHFVDEALPLPSLLSFARANRRLAKPFSFWGNVRFDPFWTRDLCAFLADSGFVAASGGLEIATERGLSMTGKGVTLAGVVRALEAFGSAGVLVHSYLIYGFPGQDDADIADSMEIVRQLFAAGLVDSAFWHRFTLTRHSLMYNEWKVGARPELRPIDAQASFASNDLGFENSERFDRWTEPLDRALSAWMDEGDTGRAAASFLPKGFPRPRIAPDFVESLYRRAVSDAFLAPPKPDGRAYWLASRPVKRRGGAVWEYAGEEHELPGGKDPAGVSASRALATIERLAGERDGLPFAELADGAGVYRLFRDKGLVVV